MKKFLHLLLLAILLTLAYLPSRAQDYYTVSVGQFVDVRPQDFAQIRSLGFLYQQAGNNNIPQVFLGHFSDLDKAEQAVSTVRARGFTNAQLSNGNYLSAGTATVIQVATRYTNRGINWEELKRIGSLNVQLDNEVVKIFTGTFPDVASAKQALPQIQALGYQDAFVKNVPTSQLLPVTSLATGIKEDLIPLNLSERQTTPAPPPPPPTVPNTTPRTPTIISSTPPTVPRATPPPTTEVPAEMSTTSARIETEPVPAPEMPKIRGNVKRNSALELQRILQGQGYYNSGLDGYYGQGTTIAYEKAIQEFYPLRKYSSLTPLFDELGATSNSDYLAWPEVQLLRHIVLDVNPAARQAAYDWQQANARRVELYQRNTPLSADEVIVLDNWHKQVTANMASWGQSDPFLAETSIALRIAYYQTLVRLENHFMDRGFDGREGRALALAGIQAIAGVGLVKFQSR